MSFPCKSSPNNTNAQGLKYSSTGCDYRNIYLLSHTSPTYHTRGHKQQRYTEIKEFEQRKTKLHPRPRIESWTYKTRFNFKSKHKHGFTWPVCGPPPLATGDSAACFEFPQPTIPTTSAAHEPTHMHTTRTTPKETGIQAVNFTTVHRSSTHRDSRDNSSFF